MGPEVLDVLRVLDDSLHGPGPHGPLCRVRSGRLPDGGPAGQGPAGVRLGLALEAVGGVGHPQPAPVVRPGHRPQTLLDDVGELVGEGVPVASAVADHDVIAGGVGAGPDLGGGAPGDGIVVDANRGEVRAQA